jgi:hypothetical protein
MPLSDPGIERTFVMALIANPAAHDALPDEIDMHVLSDLQARATFLAIVNVRARGAAVTAASVRAELAATGIEAAVSGLRGKHDRGWFDDLVERSMPPAPSAALIAGWAKTLLRLSAKRNAAIDEGEGLRAEHQPMDSPVADAEVEAPASSLGYVSGVERSRTERRRQVARDAARGVSEPAKGARVVTMSTIEREHIEWLWAGRIPRGMLVMLDGDPGVGKSTVTLDLAARITTGKPMPFETSGRPAADVLLIGAEDHPAATIRPRLDAAEADARRVHHIAAIPRGRHLDAAPTLGDVDEIERVVVEYKAALVVVDPLMAHLPANVDAYRDAAMRALLTPWAQMSARTGAAIVIIRHPRKGTGSALYRGGGSIGIIGAARSAMLVARDPSDPGASIVAHAKSNLAPLAVSLRFRVIDRDGVGRIEWLGPAEGVTADQLAAVPDDSRRNDDADLVETAAQALCEVLAGGPRPSTEALAAVRAMTGASQRTIERARSILRVKAQQSRDPNGRALGWELTLPDGVGSSPDRHVRAGGDVVERRSANSAESLNVRPHRQTASVHTANDSWPTGEADEDGEL